jgi:Xaa-Pro dipeptidase
MLHLEKNMIEQISRSLYQLRQDRLADTLAKGRLDGLALNAGPSLNYLTGLSFHVSERPVVALFVPGNPPVLVIPELEAGKAQDLPYPIELCLYGEDPDKWPAVFSHAATSAGVQNKNVGVEPTHLRVLELRLLKHAVPQTRFKSAESIISRLRIINDDDEVASIREAVSIAQEALEATLKVIQPGLTERQIASRLTQQLYQAGSDPGSSLSPIVSAGPNGANPHAVPTDRKIQLGDLLVIDWGALFQGYHSDITRTFSIGPSNPELANIASVVSEANAAAQAIVKPGIPAEAVDQAARRVIQQAGYGEFFIHRTGHGLGMEVHEPPYLRAGNTHPLEPGMVFTIEPGIYLPGRGGVRIEDNLVVTQQGSECLTDLPRELEIIGG